MSKLKDVAENIFSGITPKSGGEAYCEDGINFIRSGELQQDGSISEAIELKIKPEIHTRLMKSSKVIYNDVLIAIVGATIGKVGLYKNDVESNINQAIAGVRLKPDTILPEFLLYYLMSPVGQTYLEYLKRPVARANINLEEIGSIEIPLFSIEQQIAFCMKFKKSINTRKSKLTHANELLSDMDEFVLKMLDLMPAHKKGRCNYAIKFTDIDKRLDADYYSDEFKELRQRIHDSKHEVKTIGDICISMKSGFAAGRQDQANEDEEGIPHLRPFNITPNGQLSFEMQKFVPIDDIKYTDFCEIEDVIFNNTNSAEWVGKTTIFDSALKCACSNHITRLKLKNGINPYYISALFNAFRGLGYWKLLSTYFNNQAGVNMDTLKEVIIVLPPPELQQKIADEAVRRRTLARKFKDEAEKEWQTAMVEFEKEILGGMYQ